jgi:flagellar motor switch protein FliM
LHARFSLVFNQVEMLVDLCLPRRALEELSPSRLTSIEDTKPAAWSRSLQHQLNSTPVESIAVLCEKEVTVAQLLSMSIGQVLPIDLGEPVRLMVDGVSLLSGRYGVRNGHYAIKVEQVNEQHAVRDLAPAPSGASPDAAAWDVPPKAQADLMAAAEAMNQLADQIQKNEGAM